MPLAELQVVLEVVEEEEVGGHWAQVKDYHGGSCQEDVEVGQQEEGLQDVVLAEEEDQLVEGLEEQKAVQD